MCQLHYISSPNDTLNRTFLLAVTTLSARENNNDGVGIYSSSWGLFKTEIAANCITNYGKILSQHSEKSEMVMAHTRAASPGIVVNVENTHPFEGERFVLGHNGRLWKKEDVVTYQAQNSTDGISSDSKEFLTALEKYAKENPSLDFKQLLTDVMSNHKGKFALLIYDKRDKLYYAARGKLASLFKLNFMNSDTKKAKSIGYAITTGKDELYDAGILACNIIQLQGEKIVVGEIEELATESIFLLSSTAPVLLGEIKESAANFTQPTQQGTLMGGWERAGTGATFGVTTDSKALEPAIFIGNFMKSHKLSILDMDRIFYTVFGYGMMSATEKDTIKFAKICKKMSIPKKVRKILAKAYLIPLYPGEYKTAKLMFPWMINPTKELLRACKEREK